MQFSALSNRVGGRRGGGGGGLYLAHSSILSSATPAPLSPALLSFDEKGPPAALVRGCVHLHSRDVPPRSSAGLRLNLTPSFSPPAFAGQQRKRRRPAVPSVPPEPVLQLSVAAGARGIKSSSGLDAASRLGAAAGRSCWLQRASAGFRLQLLLFLLRLKRGDKHSDGPVSGPTSGMQFGQILKKKKKIIHLFLFFFFCFLFAKLLFLHLV